MFSTFQTYPGKPVPSPITLNSDIRTDNNFKCHKVRNHKDLSVLQEEGAFINHSCQYGPVGLGILPNEFLMPCYHDIDGIFIVINGNIVTSACLEYHEALETIFLQEFKHCIQWDYATSVIHSIVRP